jgi:hypothetical protein
VKDCSGRDAVLIAAVNTLVEVACLARLAFRLKVHHALGVAADALQAFGPANLFKVLDALLFRTELLHDLENRGLHFVRLSAE